MASVRLSVEPPNGNPNQARRAASAGDQRTAAQLVSRSDWHQHQTDVADLLAVAVPSLLATANFDLVNAALALQDIAVSIPEAIEVSRLSASDALDIPVNRVPGLSDDRESCSSFATPRSRSKSAACDSPSSAPESRS